MFQLVIFALLLLILAGIWVPGLLLGWPLVLMIVGSILAVLGAALLWLVRKILAIRRSQRIERQLLAQAERQQQQAAPEARSAIEAIRASFLENLTALKRSSAGGTSSLYDLPWFLTIGLPGSGKTTAIRKSGLTFPDHAQGGEAVRGIGGTRDCDWWFTDQAIFLDTAGRYTSEQEDREEWRAFLELVRQQRHHRAINGVIVTAAIPDLVRKDASEIEDHARLIRERLSEIATHLKVVVPFYVLFTKCDMVSGFKAFFRGLPEAEREGFLGHLLPWPNPDQEPGAAVFRAGLSDLLPWLHRRRIDALPEQDGLAEASKVLHFPDQLRAFGQWMEPFLDAVARPSPLPEAARLRGFFLTSSTQPDEDRGTDAPAGDLSEEGAEAHAAALEDAMARSIFLAPAKGKRVLADATTSNVFFLRNVFRKVLIPDRNLVSRSQRSLRRQHLAEVASVWGTLIAGALAAVWIISAAIMDLRVIGSTEADLERMLSVEKTNRGSKEANLAAIDTVRRRIEALEASGEHRALREFATGVYHARLKRPILQRLGADLAAELTRLYKDEDKDRLACDLMYELLNTYQMLAGRMEPDPGFMGRKLRQDERWLKAWMSEYLELNSEDQELVRRQAGFFLAHLKVGDAWHIDADDSLIEAVVRDLAERLWVRQAYEDILVTAGGLEPGQNAVSGPNQHLLQTVAQVPAAFAAERWPGVKAAIADKGEVLAERYRSIGKQRDVDDLATSLENHYRADNRRHWLAFMKGVRPVPFRSLRSATGALLLLVGKESPYHDLVRRFWESQEFELAGRPGGIQEDFAWLDKTLETLAGFQQAVSVYERQTEVGRRHGNLEPLATLAKAFETASLALDQQMRALDRDGRRDAVFVALTRILDATRDVLEKEVGGEIDEAWALTVHGPFVKQMAAMYPFAPEAEQEVLLASFSKLFNPESGNFWTMVGKCRPLQEIRILGRPLLPTARPYERAVVWAGKVSEALYPDEASAVSAPIVVQLQLREAVWDIHLRISHSAKRLREVPTGRMTFRWEEGQPLGTKIEIFIKDGKQLTRDEFSDSRWGPYRLFRAAERKELDDGRVRATWAFDGKQVGQVGTYHATAYSERPAWNVLLVDGFFSGFSCPSQVTEPDPVPELPADAEPSGPVRAGP